MPYPPHSAPLLTLFFLLFFFVVFSFFVSCSKLRVFDPDYLPYRKLLWADADTLYLKNIDHLLQEPMFTAAFTYACCNANGPPAPSGGLWVVEPSKETADRMYKLTQGPVPGTQNDVWHWGDMQSE